MVAVLAENTMRAHGLLVGILLLSALSCAPPSKDTPAAPQVTSSRTAATLQVAETLAVAARPSPSENPRSVTTLTVGLTRIADLPGQGPRRASGPEAAVIASFEESARNPVPNFGSIANNPYANIRTKVLRNDGDFAVVELVVSIRESPAKSAEDYTHTYFVANIGGVWQVRTPLNWLNDLVPVPRATQIVAEQTRTAFDETQRQAAQATQRVLQATQQAEAQQTRIAQEFATAVEVTRQAIATATASAARATARAGNATATAEARARATADAPATIAALPPQERVRARSRSIHLDCCTRVRINGTQTSRATAIDATLSVRNSDIQSHSVEVASIVCAMKTIRVSPFLSHQPIAGSATVEIPAQSERRLTVSMNQSVSTDGTIIPASAWVNEYFTQPGPGDGYWESETVAWVRAIDSDPTSEVPEMKAGFSCSLPRP
jgi:hypothetical protein